MYEHAVAQYSPAVPPLRNTMLYTYNKDDLLVVKTLGVLVNSSKFIFINIVSVFSCSGV